MFSNSLGSFISKIGGAGPRKGRNDDLKEIAGQRCGLTNIASDSERRVHWGHLLYNPENCSNCSFQREGRGVYSMPRHSHWQRGFRDWRAFYYEGKNN